MYALINKADLAITQVFEEFYNQFDSENSAQIEVPEGLDSRYLKAVDTEGVLSIVEDTEAKALVTKQAAAAAIMAQCEADLDVKMLEYVGTSDRVSALAYSNTWKDMLEAPAEYIGPLFADEGAVIAYANAKIVAAREYAKYRMGRIAQRNADIAAL